MIDWQMLEEIANWQMWGNIGSLLQGFAGVLTLVGIVFLLRQTREMARQTRIGSFSTISGLFQEFTSRMMSIQSVFVEYPELRPFFYGSRAIELEDADGNSFQRSLILAEMLLDSMEELTVLQEIASQAGAEAKISLPLPGWLEYLKDLYGLSPITQAFLFEHSDWYSPNLVQLLNESQWNNAHQ